MSTVERNTLLEAGAAALIEHVDGPTLRILARQDAATVLAAVLPLIADAIEAQLPPRVRVKDVLYREGWDEGTETAADLVRSLMEAGETDE